ncbi:MAG: hypothetical protein WBP26_02215 [Candidatus Saccharimonadales bacterium]
MPKQTKNTKKPIKKQASAKVTATKRAVTSDGSYLLKLTLFALLGLVWIKVSKVGNPYSIPIPIGLIVGLFFASKEHFQVDRKIEYAVLIAATLVGLVAPFGLYVAL